MEGNNALVRQVLSITSSSALPMAKYYANTIEIVPNVHIDRARLKSLYQLNTLGWC